MYPYTCSCKVVLLYSGARILQKSYSTGLATCGQASAESADSLSFVMLGCVVVQSDTAKATVLATWSAVVQWGSIMEEGGGGGQRVKLIFLGC